MNVTLERFAACRIVLTTEEQLLWHWMADQMINPDASIVTYKGRRFVAMDKELFLKRYDYFDHKSSQWFSSLLKSLVKNKMIERLEEGSNKYCFGQNHYVLNGMKEPVIESEPEEVKVKAKKEPRESLAVRKEKFLSDLKAYYLEHKSKYSSDLMNTFYKYWTEESKASKKLPYPHLRFEAQDFFSIGKRLATFKRNDYNNNSSFVSADKRGM